MSNIMTIARHRMGTDGEGITTLVGFYGCPLSCRYCANDYCHYEDTVRADYTPEELLEVLAVDEPYFLMTGGGVTFGGGEPLLQAAFIHEVCLGMSRDWRRTMETSLYAPWDSIAMLAEDIDYWYVDVKDADAERYRRYTGRDNETVLENLKKLVELVSPKKVCVRLPHIPDYNTEEERDEGITFIREQISPDVAIDAFTYEKFQV